MESALVPVGVRSSSYVLSNPPADQPTYPRKTSAFWFRKANCSQTYFSHESVLPPPVSVSMAWRLLERSHFASGAKASSMLLVVHSVEVPELSLCCFASVSN